MTAVYVMIGCLLALFLGIGVAALCFYLWYMTQRFKAIEASLNQLTTVSAELLGEGSFARISKGLTSLTSNMPEILAGLKEFSRVMRVFAKAALDPEEVKKLDPEAGQSGIYGYNEAVAASNEVAESAKKNILELSKEDLSHMRTDEDTPPQA